MDRLRIAVVGLGRMVRSHMLLLSRLFLLTAVKGKRHVQTLINRVPRVQVVAVCSSDPLEVQWAKDNDEYNEFGITAYANYDKMLAHPGLQAVWISTSTDVHASQSLAAIEKGLHVLCEKPLSTDLAEVCDSIFIEPHFPLNYLAKA